MLQYDLYNLGQNPKNLVIFLHGYNGTAETHQYAIDWFKQHLKNALLVVPHAPEVSDKNPQRLQWFGMLQYDAENRRALPETSTDEIFAVYNRAGADVDRCAAMINEFIDTLQQQYSFTDAHTFLCGFSQGAMLTIYTALSRQSVLGGAFAFSGLVAGADLLADKIAARPPLYLFHGVEDLKVQFKTLPHNVAWLKERHLPVEVRTYEGLDHRMLEEEIKFAADVINQAL